MLVLTAPMPLIFPVGSQFQEKFHDGNFTTVMSLPGKKWGNLSI